MPIVASHNTWLQDEIFAYPNGAQKRKGRAIYPDGIVRFVWAGIPDTFFTMPAHGRMRNRYLAGYVSIDESTVTCTECNGGWLTNGDKCPHCMYGLKDSPTYGALVFHPNLDSIRNYNAWIKFAIPNATLGDYIV